VAAEEHWFRDDQLRGNPTLRREPFHRDGWFYEEKYDGWRGS